MKNAADAGISVLFEDDGLIVCEKPYGLLSQGASGQEESLPDLLERRTGGQIYPVHRLDRTTGGLMVYAKNSETAAALSAQLTGGTFHKEYLALVHGTPEPAGGTLTDLLFYDRRAGKSFPVRRVRAGVKEAVLTYRTLAVFSAPGGTLSLLLVAPLTGRTHQIRVQFASRRMPLRGDRRYGAPESDGGIALWSYRLSFFHPGTHRLLTFELLPGESTPFAGFPVPEQENIP